MSVSVKRKIYISSLEVGFIILITLQRKFKKQKSHWEDKMRKIGIIFAVSLLLLFSFGCEDEGKNEPPVARLKLEPSSGVIYDNSTGTSYPEILLNGSESKDPDGRIVYYTFNMGEGNETTKGGDENSTTHEYKIGGVFEVSLEVEDNHGDTDKTKVELTINYEMNHRGGPLSSGDSEKEVFPVSSYNPYNATVVVNITDREIFGSSDAKVSIKNATGEEVRSEEVNGIEGTESVKIELVKSDFEQYEYGAWKVVVECTSGSIHYTCHLELYYKK